MDFTLTALGGPPPGTPPMDGSASPVPGLLVALALFVVFFMAYWLGRRDEIVTVGPSFGPIEPTGRAMALASRQLAAIERDLMMRTVERNELLARLAEATVHLNEVAALTELTEQQALAVRHAIEHAAQRRVRWAWCFSALGYFITIAVSYFVNWTSGVWKPHWLP